MSEAAVCPIRSRLFPKGEHECRVPHPFAFFAKGWETTTVSIMGFLRHHKQQVFDCADRFTIRSARNDSSLTHLILVILSVVADSRREAAAESNGSAFCLNLHKALKAFSAMILRGEFPEAPVPASKHSRSFDCAGRFASKSSSFAQDDSMKLAITRTRPVHRSIHFVLYKFLPSIC